MAELIATRSAVTIAIPAWRAAAWPGGRRLRRALHARRPRRSSGRSSTPAGTSPRAGSGRRGAARDRRPSRTSPLAGTRSSVRRSSRSPTSDPIQMASARGVWMTDVDGRRYLDAYNNVPCVGHSHPRVAEATARQARLLNTNMRYLHESAIELAERLAATCPRRPRHGPVRQLRVRGERPGLADGDDLHRATPAALHDPCLSRHLRGERGPVAGELVERARPDVDRDLGAAGHVSRDRTATRPSSRRRSSAWRPRGFAPAATILDGVLTSDGFYDLDPAYVAGARPADASRRRPLDRGRGPGRPRPDRRRDVVVPAVRHRAGLRDPRQADGQRPSGRRGHHPARDRGPVRRRDRLLQHVRRQSGVRGSGAGGARRPRGRARPAARPGGRRGPARRHPRRRVAPRGHRRRPRDGPGDRRRDRQRPRLEVAGRGRDRRDQGGPARPRRARRHDRPGRQHPQGPPAPRLHRPPRSRSSPRPSRRRWPLAESAPGSG